MILSSAIPLKRQLVKNFLLIYRFATTDATTNLIQQGSHSSLPAESSHSDIRKSVAPWVEIGKFEKGLLSHLTTKDIVRALCVLRLCSFDPIVSRSLELFEVSTRLGRLGDYVLRKTFFDQFVGGDEEKGMAKVVSAMQERGLVLMVAPVLEEDVEDEQASKKTYDENLQTLKGLASMTSKMEKKKPLIQLKPTAIMPAHTLEKVSTAIEKRIRIEGKSYASIVTEIANSVENPVSFSLPGLGKDETRNFLDGFRRADEFVNHAHSLKVHVVVDAEFYACKRAISSLALALMTRHNRNYHIVGNTIQGYLKDTVQTATEELKTVTSDIGVNWYGKIVRGAYMDRERFLARKHGYASPICENYEATNESYNRAVSQVLHHIASNPSGKSHLIVATHNELSIRLAAQQMKDLSLNEQDDRVSFAQIYGMADYLSTPLVKLGYHVYKSTPYGPLRKVLPYLARRASENRSVMEGAREERLMLWNEFKSRISSN